MKRLYVLRHAKSDWSSPTDRDHDRPLAERGIGATATVGRFLAGIGVEPDRILASTATRARDTAQRVAAAAGWGVPVELESGLYGASVASAMLLISACDDTVDSLLVVGHEPTMSSLSASLVGGGSLRVTTAALIAIDLAISAWEEITPRCGVLRWMVTPKLLRRAGVD